MSIPHDSWQFAGNWEESKVPGQISHYVRFHACMATQHCTSETYIGNTSKLPILYIMLTPHYFNLIKKWGQQIYWNLKYSEYENISHLTRHLKLTISATCCQYISSYLNSNAIETREHISLHSIKSDFRQ